VALEAVWWTFFSVATIFIGLRFWARIVHRNLGFDDLFMAITYVGTSHLTLSPSAFVFVEA
jgi:hypothetical protein